MPKEGQASISMVTYTWEKVKAHFKEYKTYYRKKGIKSASALVRYWCESNVQKPPDK